MAISTNPKPTIYRKLYENGDPDRDTPFTEGTPASVRP